MLFNFDGEEDRNGKRNYDEICLMVDYLMSGMGSYIYDDVGYKVLLLMKMCFVLVGDFNVVDIGDKYWFDVIE